MNKYRLTLYHTVDGKHAGQDTLVVTATDARGWRGVLRTIRGHCAIRDGREGGDGMTNDELFQQILTAFAIPAGVLGKSRGTQYEESELARKVWTGEAAPRPVYGANLPIGTRGDVLLLANWYTSCVIIGTHFNVNDVASYVVRCDEDLIERRVTVLSMYDTNNIRFREF